MPSLNDVVSQMRAALALSDPDLDTSTGTTTRKILDVVAESIAESYLDQHMLSYQYDIDSKSGADLDAFCALFGIVRIGAKRSTGTVVFTRPASATNQTILIPVNTQVATQTSPQITVITVAAAFMDIGVQTVTVPVQAIEGGVQGNVGAGLLTRILSPLQGVSAVVNIQPLTGGAPQETDSELRKRWKQTVFRAVNGSTDFYLGLARADGLLNDPGCTRANVVGATKMRREQVQIISGTAQSTADDVVYSYPSSVVLGVDIDGGDVLVRDHDYTFDVGTIPPTIHDAGGLTEGTIYDLVYEYVPQASRNDPENGISNRIDIWANGVRAVDAAQTVVFQTTKVFSATSTDPLYRDNFVMPDGTSPAAGQIFIPLAWGPIVTLPDTLTIGGTTYFQARPDAPLGTVHVGGAGTEIYAYDMVHEDTAFGWTPNSLFGLVWDEANAPPPGTVFVVSTGYTYNEVPRSIQEGVEAWRLLGTDAKVHQAKLQALRFNLAVMIDPKVSRTVVFQQIREALSGFCESLEFDSTVQLADALRVVLNVPAVDNARFMSASDYPDWTYASRNDFPTGIQLIVNNTPIETFVDSNGRPFDVEFGDAELPVFDSLGGAAGGIDEPSLRAQNTFRST